MVQMCNLERSTYLPHFNMPWKVISCEKAEEEAVYHVLSEVI